MTRKPRTAVALGTGVLAAALLLSGCSAGASASSSSSSTSAVSQAQVDKAMKTPTTLTFWAGLPKLQDEVALFEKKYPAIKVNVVNPGGLNAEYTKLRTALKAGKGAPDVAQIEYQYIPSFVVTNSLLDLRPYGAGKLASDYVPWVWKQVDQGGKIFGIPQDSGPMGDLYREDILKKAGITTPPATWDEYAKDAAALKTATGAYITDLPANDPGEVLGLLSQAGVKPFGYDGKKTVTINVATPEAKKVMSYWQKLIQGNLVSVDADFTDQWYQGLAKGKYAGWLTAAWGPVFLQGTAGDTSGLWRASELPQWKAGEDASGNWGGSSDAVVKTTKNPIAAYELVKWLNDDKVPATQFATEQFLFPTLKSVLNSPAFVSEKSKFYGGQQVNQTFAKISKTVDTKFQWLPYTDYAYSSYNDTVGKAIADKGNLSAALDDWQKDLKTYGTQQGFTVK